VAAGSAVMQPRIVQATQAHSSNLGGGSDGASIGASMGATTAMYTHIYRGSDGPYIRAAIGVYIRAVVGHV